MDTKYTLPLAVMDIEMAKAVAKAFGCSDSIVEAGLAAAGASTVGKGASEFLNFIPGFGQLIKAGLAGSVTKATREGLISYFRSQSSYI